MLPWVGLRLALGAEAWGVERQRLPGPPQAALAGQQHSSGHWPLGPGTAQCVPQPRAGPATQDPPPLLRGAGQAACGWTLVQATGRWGELRCGSRLTDSAAPTLSTSAPRPDRPPLRRPRPARLPPALRSPGPPCGQLPACTGWPPPSACACLCCVPSRAQVGDSAPPVPGTGPVWAAGTEGLPQGWRP